MIEMIDQHPDKALGEWTYEELVTWMRSKTFGASEITTALLDRAAEKLAGFKAGHKAEINILEKQVATAFIAISERDAAKRELANEVSINTGLIERAAELTTKLSEFKAIADKFRGLNAEKIDEIDNLKRQLGAANTHLSQHDILIDKQKVMIVKQAEQLKATNARIAEIETIISTTLYCKACPDKVKLTKARELWVNKQNMKTSMELGAWKAEMDELLREDVKS